MEIKLSITVSHVFLSVQLFLISGKYVERLIMVRIVYSREFIHTFRNKMPARTLACSVQCPSRLHMIGPKFKHASRVLHFVRCMTYSRMCS